MEYLTPIAVLLFYCIYSLNNYEYYRSRVALVYLLLNEQQISVAAM